MESYEEDLAPPAAPAFASFISASFVAGLVALALAVAGIALTQLSRGFDGELITAMDRAYPVQR